MDSATQAILGAAIEGGRRTSGPSDIPRADALGKKRTDHGAEPQGVGRAAVVYPFPGFSHGKQRDDVYVGEESPNSAPDDGPFSAEASRESCLTDGGAEDGLRGGIHLVEFRPRGTGLRIFFFDAGNDLFEMAQQHLLAFGFRG